MRTSLLTLAASLCLMPTILQATNIYDNPNQTEWQSYATIGNQNALTSINLDPSLFADALLPIPKSTEEDGIAFSEQLSGRTINHGNFQDAMPSVPNLTGGVLTGGVGYHNDYLITFGQPIYSLGFDVKLPAPERSLEGPLLYELVTLRINTATGGFYDTNVYLSDGFNGIISKDPFSSFELYYGGCTENGTMSSSPECGGSSFVLSDLQVSTTSVPEPAFIGLFAGGLVLAGLAVRSRARH